jgi:hypothetical protein
MATLRLLRDSLGQRDGGDRGPTVMRWLTLALPMIACRPPPPHPPVVPPPHEAVPIVLEWSVTPRDAGRVNITLRAGAGQVALPPLSATTSAGATYTPGPTPPGDPATCEVRRVDATTSQLSCGRSLFYNYYAAELRPHGELAITLVTGIATSLTDVKREDVAHVAVDGDVLQNAPLRVTAER